MIVFKKFFIVCSLFFIGSGFLFATIPQTEQKETIQQSIIIPYADLFSIDALDEKGIVIHAKNEIEEEFVLETTCKGIDFAYAVICNQLNNIDNAYIYIYIIVKDQNLLVGYRVKVTDVKLYFERNITDIEFSKRIDYKTMKIKKPDEA